jgi:hypothetical protein
MVRKSELVGLLRVAEGIVRDFAVPLKHRLRAVAGFRARIDMTHRNMKLRISLVFLRGGRLAPAAEGGFGVNRASSVNQSR